MKKTILSLLACFGAIVLMAQPAINESTLTIDQIMQGEKFVGFSPSSIDWSWNNKTVYFSWNPEGNPLRSLYKVAIDGQAPEKVSLEEEQARVSWNGSYSEDYSAYVYQKNGDLYLIDDMTTGEQVQLTNTIARESAPSFTSTGAIIYQSGNDLFVWDSEKGITQLTQFKKGNAPGNRPKREFKRWLEEDQMELFEILEERETKSDLRRADRAERQPQRPLPIYFGNGSVGNVRISPDLRFVSYQIRQAVEYIGTKVPSFVTTDGFIDDLRARPKVGSPQATYKFGIYDRENDTTYQLDLSQVEGIKQKPGFLKEYHDGEGSFEEDYDFNREVIVHGPYYSSAGQAVVVIRSLDNKDRWIMMLEPENNSLKLLDRQRDEAWIGGPGIGSWNFSGGNIGWLDEDHIYFQSEATGFSHLYSLNIKTKKKTALTEGGFEIISATLSKDKTRFFITANAESPHQQHFYHLDWKAKKGLEKITSLNGNNQVSLSPDEKYLAIRYSYSNKPWELMLMENKAGATARQITRSTTGTFNAYSWRVPEVVYFKAEDGANVPARIYRPEKPKRGGPAVIFVHGAGYLQNVHNWWSSYYREYMFHNLLVDNGYTVLDIDYRASSGYGRDWRTGIYRHMGGKDLSDQVDGAKFLVEKYEVDPERIGIYGGSYGGFITLMALFNSPGTFKCGAALRSVTDWAHYNHGYTANILNTPVEDPIAFRRSSPIYFAEGLQDHLLILHGMIDTNVQFQDVVRLSQRLIELRKDNWEFSVFPLEGHGFVEASSWADEYKRIFKLFQTHLK